VPILVVYAMISSNSGAFRGAVYRVPILVVNCVDITVNNVSCVGVFVAWLYDLIFL